jgi:LPXTG-motif cell wall-anchored protein
VIRAGTEVTISAGGFGANETGIRLELHSDPIVLATGLTANAAGVVTATFTIPADAPTGAHTLVLIGATNQAQVAITIAAALPTCTARAVSGATFSWGVRQSFRSYVTGPIASGSISSSGVSGSGPWTWSGGTGTFNTSSVLGQASWSGSVHFTGHNGALDVTLSSPTVRITSASAATLYLTATDSDGNTSRVAFATLNLAGGSSSIGSEVARWTSVPATLTAAGAAAFAGFYSAGEALDPVSFTLPLGAEVECDATTGALATTGSDGAGSLTALAGMLILGGAGLAVSTRRRRRGARLVTA